MELQSHLVDEIKARAPNLRGRLTADAPTGVDRVIVNGAAVVVDGKLQEDALAHLPGIASATVFEPAPGEIYTWTR